MLLMTMTIIMTIILMTPRPLSFCWILSNGKFIPHGLYTLFFSAHTTTPDFLSTLMANLSTYLPTPSSFIFLLPLVPPPCPHNLHSSFSFPFSHCVKLLLSFPVSLFSSFTAVHYRCSHFS